MKSAIKVFWGTVAVVTYALSGFTLVAPLWLFPDGGYISLWMFLVSIAVSTISCIVFASISCWSANLVGFHGWMEWFSPRSWGFAEAYHQLNMMDSRLNNIIQKIKEEI
jgi:hypothetical protein